MIAGRYRVIDDRSYRWHPPGTVFEDRLDSATERRAVARGAIEVIERIELSVPAERRLPRQGSFRLPPGVTPAIPPPRGAPEGRLSR